MKKVSIIIPAYNEEESLPFLYERVEKVINGIDNYEFEILFDKYKDILTEDDKEHMRFIIEKRIRDIDKQRENN